MKKKFHNFLYKLISTRQFPYEVEIIAQDLNIPWAIDISDEGKIYFTERSGSIKVIENGINVFTPELLADIQAQLKLLKMVYLTKIHLSPLIIHLQVKVKVV